MKTRYYRHNDPRRGFKICEELQIPSQERLMFSGQIEEINKIYRQCSEKHSQSFLSQPNQNQILQKAVLLLVLPLLVSYVFENTYFLVQSYVISIAALIYFVIQYMDKINQCREKFDLANQAMSEQFCQLQSNFQEKWPQYSMVLMRQWNQFNETCTQYIEIYRKQDEPMEVVHQGPESAILSNY